MATLFVCAVAGPAYAKWGPEKRCDYPTEPENEHCYALAKKTKTKVLASIDFVDSTAVEIPHWENGEIFVSNEEWISFESSTKWIKEGWIEDGQLAGAGYSCCEMHPFYAEEYKGTLKVELSPGTMPLNNYNHYVIFDSEINGRWHIFWESGEAGYLGGGWPAYLNIQEAGIEASDDVKPHEWGRDMVAASDGGEWWPWTGATWYRDPGICQAVNEESSAAGNTMWGTIGGVGGECP